MKKILVLFLVSILSFPIFARAEFDLGDGRLLILNDDGRYEIIEKDINLSAKQYKLDLNKSLESIAERVRLSDERFQTLDALSFNALVKESGVFDAMSAEIPSFSIIFISKESALLIYEGSDPLEVTYRATGDGVLYLDNEISGRFNRDFSEILISDPSSSIPLYLIRQN